MCIYLYNLAVLLPEKEPLYPLNIRLGESQTRSGIFDEAINLFTQLGIELSTIAM